MPLRDSDTPPPRGRVTALFDDLASGFGLLSRLPVPLRPFTGARSVWAWPLVGALLGGAAAAVAAAGQAVGLPAGLIAAAVMATGAILTGAMHEDGLADSADGLFGGWTKERRLEIMKDSRIGSYGVLALLLAALARWSALVALIEAGPIWAVLLAVGCLSRAPMAVLMAALPPARPGGLSAGTGRPPAARVAVGLVIAGSIATAACGAAALPFALAACLPALLMAGLARARIGGQTGDILGATQHLAEVAILGTAAALIT